MISKNIFILIMLSFIISKVFSFPFNFGNYQNVNLKSSDGLYFLREEDLPNYEKYKVNDAYIFCIADNNSDLIKRR